MAISNLAMSLTIHFHNIQTITTKILTILNCVQITRFALFCSAVHCTQTIHVLSTYKEWLLTMSFWIWLLSITSQCTIAHCVSIENELKQCNHFYNFTTVYLFVWFNTTRRLISTFYPTNRDFCSKIDTFINTVLVINQPINRIQFAVLSYK